MKVCSIPLCRNDSFKRPDLSYFNLPRNVNVREEWLEVIGVKRKDSQHHISICEIHFLERDFKAGKKELKTHAIPVLRLGTGKADPIDSDDEFTAYGSESEPEIVEIKQNYAPTSRVQQGAKNKKKTIQEAPKIEPKADIEQEPGTGRRPSRRAALVAAKKIFNTARNHGIQDDPEDLPASFAIHTPKAAVSPRPYTRQKQPPKKINIIPCDVDLVMECDDENLSQLQVKILYDAQNHYNDMMRNFRELTACNVRIVSLERIEPVSADVPLNAPAQNKNAAEVVKMPRYVKIEPKPTVPAVLKMALSKGTGNSSATPIIIL